MPDYLMNDIVLVRYPFSDLRVFKVRPAIIVSACFSRCLYCPSYQPNNESFAGRVCAGELEAIRTQCCVCC